MLLTGKCTSIFSLIYVPNSHFILDSSKYRQSSQRSSNDPAEKSGESVFISLSYWLVVSHTNDHDNMHAC